MTPAAQLSAEATSRRFAAPPDSGAQTANFVSPHAWRITLEPAGRLFLPLFGIGALLGWAAGGIGLLFAAFGLAVLFVAFVLAWRNTNALQLHVLPSPAHSVGEAFLFPIELRSKRQGACSRDLYLSIAEDRKGRGEPGDRPVGGRAEIEGGSTQRLSVGYRHQRRGRRTELEVLLHSSYPFGLLRIDRSFRVPVDLLAWPRLGRLRNKRRLNSRPIERQERRERSPLQEDEFFQLREWRKGMSLRRAHWKLSAKRGRPILQELRGDLDGHVHLGLSSSVCERIGVQRGQRHSFESAVCLVATLLQHHLSSGCTVNLALEGEAGSYEVHTGLRGRRGLLQGMDALALIEARVVDAATLGQGLLQGLEVAPGSTWIYAGGDRLEAGAAQAASLGALSSRALSSKAMSSKALSLKTLPLKTIDVDSPHIDDVFQRSGSGVRSRFAEEGLQ